MKRCALIVFSLITSVRAYTTDGNGTLTFGANEVQIYLLKTHYYTQTGNNSNADQNQPLGLLAMIRGGTVTSNYPSGANYVTTAADPGTHLLDLAFVGGIWTGEMRFPNQAALDTAVVDGNFVFNFGGFAQTVTLSGGLYPNNPVLGGSDYWQSGVIHLDPSQQFNQYTGTFTSNFVNGGSSWSTAEIIGTGFRHVSRLNEADFVNPPNTFNTLSGGTYMLESGFYRFSDIVAAAGGDSNATAFVGYASLNTMSLQVIPEPASWAGLIGLASLAAAVVRRRDRRG